MAVIRAEGLGFCDGGRTSIEKVKQLARTEKKPVHVYGYLLHNKQIIQKLKAMGVVFLKPDPNLKADGKLVIRAHGVSEAVMRRLADQNELVDLTCPKVYKIHALAKFFEKKGYHILYLGKPGHPEAEGTLGNLNHYSLITCLEDAKHIKLKKLAFIAQSTCSASLFDEIAAYLKAEHPDTIILDTLCDSTRQRQLGAETLAKNADLMVVLGGKDSSNTRELYEICKKHGPTLWVELPEEVHQHSELIKQASTIGVTAGASTPDEDIDKLHIVLEEYNGKSSAHR
jgi:(E)-4-hydroxy-3-methyl-but-2-enyl pyrophosphate reductase